MLSNFERKIFKAYDAYDLAKYIVNKCVDDRKPISNLQLQKILYFIQYNYLRNFRRPAFYNTIEAWKYGPVVPDVYNKFTYLGGNLIMRSFVVDTKKMFSDNLEQRLVDNITETCRTVDPWALVRRVHKKGTPWERVYKKNQRKEITVQNIYEFIQERN